MKKPKKAIQKPLSAGEIVKRAIETLNAAWKRATATPEEFRYYVLLLRKVKQLVDYQLQSYTQDPNVAAQLEADWDQHIKEMKENCPEDIMLFDETLVSLTEKPN